MLHLMTSNPELMPMLLASNESSIGMLKDALSLGTACKVSHLAISTKLFFNSFMNSIVPSCQLLATSLAYSSESNKTLAQQYRHLSVWRNGTPIQSHHEFADMLFHEIFGGPEGLEFVSLINDPCHYKLVEEKPLRTAFTIPTHLLSEPKEIWKLSPFITRSPQFFAINKRSDSAIYVFTSADKAFYTKYEVEGEIYQLAIHDNSLIVLEENVKFQRKLTVFSLDCKDKPPFAIPLPENEKIIGLQASPVCFGKNYLIYKRSLYRETQLCALPITFVTTPSEGTFEMPWLQGPIKPSVNYLFAEGDNFVEVLFSSNEYVNISQIEITSEGFRTIKIAEDISFFDSTTKMHRAAVDFHLGRLFVAYEVNPKETQIISYDVETRVIEKFLSSPSMVSNCPSGSRFVYSTFHRVHYLVMSLGKSDRRGIFQMKTYMTTIEYQQKSMFAPLLPYGL